LLQEIRINELASTILKNSEYEKRLNGSTDALAYTPKRRFIGYGEQRPALEWPEKARIALNFVINYEEGAEYSIFEGDTHSETLLSDVPANAPIPGVRDRNIESLYEYGSAVGVWRLIDIFRKRGLSPTFYVVGRALEINPIVGEKIAELGSDIICHGWRWVDYQFFGEEAEREHIKRTYDTIKSLTGKAPTGWYTGRPSLNTRRLVVEHGGFLFDSDDYNDDLPYWVNVDDHVHLVIPHSFDTNDSRFSRGGGLETSEQFFNYLRDAFDCLYQEGEHQASMMTVSLHCRLAGRPGRAMGLAKFLDYVQKKDAVWLAQRTSIARHWHENHRPLGADDDTSKG